MEEVWMYSEDKCSVSSKPAIFDCSCLPKLAPCFSNLDRAGKQKRANQKQKASSCGETADQWAGGGPTWHEATVGCQRSAYSKTVFWSTSSNF